MTLEDLKAQVSAIQKSVQKIRASGISEQALVILIQANSESIGGKYSSQKPNRNTIRAVLNSMETLEDFLTKDGDDDS